MRVGFGPRPFYMLGDATSCMLVGFIKVRSRQRPPHNYGERTLYQRREKLPLDAGSFSINSR